MNAPQLRRELEYTGAIFQTSIDSELIACHIARERLNCGSVEEAVSRAMRKLQGAYSLVIMSPRKLIGSEKIPSASGLCASERETMPGCWRQRPAPWDTVGAQYVRDVLPGEIVTISPEKGIESDTRLCLPEKKQARCVFEYIYFSRPDSYFDGVSVYQARCGQGAFWQRILRRLRILWQACRNPGTARRWVMPCSPASPTEPFFVKNSYIGRTFIRPGTEGKGNSVQVKLTCSGKRWRENGSF